MITTQLPASSVLASAQRCDARVIAEQSAAVSRHAEQVLLLDAVPTGVLILNQCRQIVFCNAAAANMAGAFPREKVYGLRPGEALDCRESHCPGGCGTNRACEFCGTAKTIEAAISCLGQTSECRIAQAPGGNALDLRVSCSPITIEGQRFVVVGLVDIADEKRRRALERVFFHDVRNVLGALLGHLQLATMEGAAVDPTDTATALSVAQCLADEIASFEELLRAESGELQAQMQPVQLAELCAGVAALLQRHEVASGRQIVLSDRPEVTVKSDARLLRRVLVNLIKNALEASPRDGRVRLDWGVRGGETFVRVHNEGFMPREVQLQLFQRSFTTKGPGRGLGTYSVRLFTEKYLGGRVTVTSCPEEGTAFSVYLPHQ